MLLSEVESSGNLLSLLHVGELVLDKLLLQMQQLFGSEDCPGFLGHAPLPSLEATAFGYGHGVGVVEVVVHCSRI